MTNWSGNIFDEQEACHIVEDIKIGINSERYVNCNGNLNQSDMENMK